MADKDAPGGKFVMKPGTNCLSPYLKNFSMSNDGENFIFTTLDLASKEVEALNQKTIEEVKDVYTVLLSGNNVADPTCLKELQNLIHLELQKNKIKNVSVFCLEDTFLNLRYLDLSNNKFTELPAFQMPQLQYLDISHNKLEKINESWNGHPNLRILNVAENKFKNLSPFKNCPKLEELYAQNNSIANISGHDGLPNLRILNLRHNKIESIGEELAELPSLEVLNLRTNRIPDLQTLMGVFQFTTIKNLNVLNCPVELGYSSMNIFIGEILKAKPDMQRFCKVNITDAQRLESVYYSKYQWNKSEEERIAKEKLEAEAAAKAEAEEGG